MTDALSIGHLEKRFPVKGGVLHAVDGVSLTLAKGESLGLVGESGCGKSTLVRLVARLIDPSEGRIWCDGTDIGAISARRFGALPERAKIQVVFQDPTDSLNPHFRALESIMDPLRRLRPDLSRAAAEARARETAALCGLPEPLLDRYPHQLSGGQKARVGIARALAPEPEVLILDEPTSALDVSVQSQVLNLMSDLRAEFGLTYLFISHDLTVVHHMADMIGVLYLGRLVEEAPRDRLFADPKHPYTRMLFDAAPRMDAYGREVDPPRGEIPDAINPPSGCAFHPRCPLAVARCSRERPEMRRIGDTRVACHLAE